jgi:hypothetical protein
MKVPSASDADGFKNGLHVFADNLGLGFVAFLMQIALAGRAVVFLDRKSMPR